jgi:hypothetical protein
MAINPIAPETGDPLLTTNSYESAVAAVDALADARFPVERVTIIGHGISTVEKVTGRYGYVRALGSGALTGAVVGLLFGLLFDWLGALEPSTGWGGLALGGLIYGAVVGGLIGVVLHGVMGGERRDFVSARSLQADRYEVLIAGGDRGEADRILRHAGLLGAGSSR